MKIGFLGLGAMGSGMVTNLLNSGHEVTVWNRTPSSVSTGTYSSSYSHFYVGSMYDVIRLHVARSYASFADSPFSSIRSLTLSNHLLLGLPLFLRSFISIALPPT